MKILKLYPCQREMMGFEKELYGEAKIINKGKHYLIR
ncbi:hypothetical protein LCGC14_0689970 [marine sediment metagenome]|uniref:Uncharacterized protein n=1 Tax=marine sediment metagenome TaxID=412755 RepID=A0A0F9QKS7_9ZZZZ